MSAEKGREALREFLVSFNAQDHERHGRSLNYPHVRLANGHFQHIESAEELAERSRQNKPRLIAEGWHHSEARDLVVVHADDTKVHLAMRMDRCREDGTVYKSFDTFWIATEVDSHWGIQFRSSYLV